MGNIKMVESAEGIAVRFLDNQGLWCRVLFERTLSLPGLQDRLLDVAAALRD